MKRSVNFLTSASTGDSLGLKIEEEFTKKAKDTGLSEEEAKDAFNNNMMATGLLSELPLDFARENNRRWLVAEYEAGDVVLHKPHAVWKYYPLISVNMC